MVFLHTLSFNILATLSGEHYESHFAGEEKGLERPGENCPRCTIAVLGHIIVLKENKDEVLQEFRAKLQRIVVELSCPSTQSLVT